MILRHLAPADAIGYLRSREGYDRLEAILDHEPVLSSAQVLQDLLAGRLELRLAEGEEASGMLLSFEDRRNPKRPCFYVFGLAMVGRGWHAAMQHALKELALAKGCGSVQARSCRRGWSRWAARMGWKPTEWLMEVEA